MEEKHLYHVAETKPRCDTCGLPGHFARDCRKGKNLSGASGTGPRESPARPTREVVQCYNCGQRGHVACRSPDSTFFLWKSAGPAGLSNYRSGDNYLWRNMSCWEDVLLDTSCSRTFVRSNLVPQEKIIDREVVTICCAHVDTVLYPVVSVELEVEGRPITVEAAVLDTLPMAVLLGRDVPVLSDLRTLWMSRWG